MANEKMMILKMLEEGKISASEAARLLAAAEAPPASHTAPYDSAPRPNSPAPPKPDVAADDISKRFGAFVKDVEPKLKHAARVVAAKTAGAADAVSRSMSGYASRPDHQGHAPRPGYAKSSTAGVEQSVEIKISQPHSELNLTGLNGQVHVKGYNGDRISAKIFTVAKRAGAKIELAVLGSKYYLAYDENDFERVCIDAFVPETLFDNVRISSTNGNVRFETMVTSYVHVENSNGATEVAGISARVMSVECNNGTLRLANCQADRATCENFNGAVSVSKIDISELKIATFNGAIDMQIAGFDAYDHYKWNVETSNGQLTLLLPSYNTLGYHVKGHAALDNVKLGLVGMNYLRNDRSHIEARSINYDEAVKKVDLELTTSNAPLVVN